MTDRRGGGHPFLDTSPTPTIVAPPPGVDAPVSGGEVRDAHWLLGGQDIDSQGFQAEIDAYSPIVNALTERNDKDPKAQRDIFGNTRGYFGAYRSNHPLNYQAIWDDVNRIRKTDPGFLPDIPANNMVEFTDWVKKREQAKRNWGNDIVSRQKGAGQAIIGFGTDMASGFRDPVNLGAMALSGGAAAPVDGAITSIWTTMGRAALREGIVNSATAVAQTPELSASRARFGETLTVGDAAENVATAFGTGAIFGTVHTGGGAALKATGRAVADGPMGRAASEIATPFAARMARPEPIAPADIIREFSASVDPSVRTPEESAALHVVQRQADVDASNPYEPTPAGMDAHADALDRVMADIVHAGDPNTTAPKVTPRRTPQTVAAARTPRIDLTPDNVIHFVINDLEGGAALDHSAMADGGLTKYGISQRAEPDVDIANLTEAQAAGIARRKYWLPEFDHMDPRTAAVLFDAHYSGGRGAMRQILRDSGGDAERAMELYRARLNRIADTVPGKAKFKVGWNNRLDKLQRMLGLGGEHGDRPILRPEAFGDDTEALAESQRAIDAADAEVAARVRGGLSADEPAPPVATASGPLAYVEPRHFDLEAFYKDSASAPADAAHPLTPRGDGTFYQLHTLTRAELEEIARTAPKESQVDEGITTREQAQEVLREHVDYKYMDTAHLSDIVQRTLVENRRPDWIERVQTGRGHTGEQAAFVRLGGALAALKERGDFAGLQPKLVASLMDRGASRADAEEIIGARMENLQRASRPRLAGPSPAEAPAMPAREPLAHGTPEHEAASPSAESAAKLFDRPDSPEAERQTMSLDHDARLILDADPEATFRIGDDEAPRTIAEIMAEQDADEAAIEAARNCL